MIYAFEDPNGEEVLEQFAAGTAPKFGEKILISGVECTRVLSLGCLKQKPRNRKHPLYPYVSNALPRRLEGCEHDKSGRPIIRSKRHETEIARKNGYAKY